jgi:hypothetical protein
MSQVPVHVAQAPRPQPLRVSRTDDADEREAARAADVAARGGSVANWSFSGAGSPGGRPPVHHCTPSDSCLCDACGAIVGVLAGAAGGAAFGAYRGTPEIPS